MNLIYDIGANIGTTSDIFKNIAKKVVCFEPNPQLKTILDNKFKNTNVTVDGRGVSNHNGIQKFKIASTHTISTFAEDWINSSRFTHEYTWNSGIEVATITLDSIIDEYGTPDYIKIDIEGYEYEVISSFTKLIPNMVVGFEWAEEQKTKIELTLNHLVDLGYNKFSYTEADKVLFDTEIEWKTIDNLSLIENLDSNRKNKWGMIYFKFVPES